MSLAGQHRGHGERQLHQQTSCTPTCEEIYVYTSVSVVLRVEGLHPQGSQELLLSHLQSFPGSLHCEQLWGLSAQRQGEPHATAHWIQTGRPRPTSTYHHHGNGEVGSQLVVAPGAGRSVGVFIDASLVHQVRAFLIGVVRVPGHPEPCFEGLLELLVPLGVGDEHQLTWKDGGGVNHTVCLDSLRAVSVLGRSYRPCEPELRRKGRGLWRGAPPASARSIY